MITVDIDKPYKAVKQLIDRWLELLPELSAEIALWECRPSPSGNTHCIFYFTRPIVDCKERFRIARLLGDDPLRSWLNYIRCTEGEARELLFYAKKRYARALWPGQWFWS